MRKWIIAGCVTGTIAVVAAATVINLKLLIQRNRDFLIGWAEQAFGRKISVGEIETTLFSGVGMRLTNFTMTDDPRNSSGDFVRAKDLRIRLKFWPLLRKEFQVKTIVLHDPVIQIVRAASGEFNFSTIGKSEKEKKARGDKEPAEPKNKDSAALQVSLVNISGGDIRYLDKKDGSDLRARQIDLEVEDFDFDRPFLVKLAAALFADKQNVMLTTKVGPLGSTGGFNQVPVSGELEIYPLDITQLKKALPNLKNVLPKGLDLAGVVRVKALKFNGTLNDFPHPQEAALAVVPLKK